MNRASKILLAVMAAAAPAAAQNGPSPTPAPAHSAPDSSPAAGPDAGDASSIVLADKAPTLAPLQPDDGSGRSVSAKIAEDLASGMPRYNPPTPTPTPAAEPLDMRDVDKPRNEIRRLPKYVVRESRPPVFRNRDLYTTEGLAGLGFKRHPGLGFPGNILGLNSEVAYQMYLDDERLANIEDLTDTARAMARGGDKAESEYILKASQETYIRPIEETWNGPGGGGGFSGGIGR
ncbi:MAG TPA: hypothetical protein VKG78_10180 [Opitutaceae bacterium]|nr:hypothetical protein [Opitutaceae bacterium]